MAMTWIWTGMVLTAVICGLAQGRGPQVAAAAMEGAGAAVELCLSIGGILCLWGGIMENMRRAGLTEKLGKALRPLLFRLFPETRRDRALLEDIAANLSANLLGLGNAATPLGIRAARGLAAESGGPASDSMCMLIVCNSASIQLIPATVAAVRSAAGSPSPFDIIPAVWLSSAASVCAGILMCRLLGRVWRS